MPVLQRRLVSYAIRLCQNIEAISPTQSLSLTQTYFLVGGQDRNHPAPLWNDLGQFPQLHCFLASLDQMNSQALDGFGDKPGPGAKFGKVVPQPSCYIVDVPL